MNKKYCSPLTVKLNKNLELKTVYSIHDSTGINISGVEFADLVDFETILTAPQHPDYGQLGVVKNSKFLDITREVTGDEDLGVLLLYVSNKLILFVDDDRELLVEFVDV